MKSKFILTIAASLLAGTVFAAAQQDGAPANERDQSGATTDSSLTSAYPEREPESGTVGYGGGMRDGRYERDRGSLQPNGMSPSEPPQGRSTGQSAYPRPR